MESIKGINKYISILMIGFAIMFVLTACSNDNDKDDEAAGMQDEQDIKIGENETEEVITSPYVGETILSVDDEKVSYSEVILYLKYIQTYYESIFGETIWDYDLGDKTIGGLAKQDVIDTIIERKITKKQWNEYEVIITEEDEAKIEKDSLDYLNNITDYDISYYGITNEIVYQFFFDNLLAERVYDATTMDVDTDISDDLAKQITIQYILISTTKLDSEGNRVLVTEDKKQAAYIKAQELLTPATDTEDFELFAKTNSDSAQIEKTFGKGEVEEVVESAAFALKAGDISNIIESEDGYLILYCVSDYNEDATLEKKEEIIDQRQIEEFQRLFQEWQKDVDVKINESVWSQVEFD